MYFPDRQCVRTLRTGTLYVYATVCDQKLCFFPKTTRITI